MNSVEISAKTREEAVEQALQQLDASISDVDIEVLDEGSKGLFGLFGSRLAKVRVTLKGASSAAAEDELDIMSLLSDKKPEKAPRAESERKPKPERPEKRESVKAEKADKPEKADKAEKAEGEGRKRRPEPVRRTNPARKAAEAPEAEAVDAPAEEAAAAVEPAAEQAEAEAEKATEPRRRSRSRSRKPRKPAAETPVAEDGAEEEAPQAAKPLPPKQIDVKPLEKPEVTMIPDEELDAESAAGRAKAFLQELTHLMGVDVAIAMGTDPEGNVFGYMTGDTLGILIGRRGETLDALQYLTSLRINRGQEGYTRVTLDTENYRAKREDTLIRLANRMANRAVKSGRRVALEAMNPYERRIIHSALQPNELVETHSEGEEPNRHVVITVRKG